MATEYFTLAEFRKLPDVGGKRFKDSEIEAAEAYFVKIVEREIGVNYQARSVTDTLDGEGTDTLLLSRSDVNTLTSVTVDGTVVDKTLFVVRHGVLRYKLAGSSATFYTFPVGVGNVVVVYTAGLSSPPGDIKDAVMQATRDRLLTQADANGIDPRRTSMTTEYGTTTYVLPSGQNPTGYPELDALIASYQRTASPLGIG